MSGQPRVARKWRPPLGLVVLVLLLAVLALPSGLIIVVRILDAGRGGLSALEAGVLAVSLLLTLVIAYVLTRAVTAPVEALSARTREISTGGRDAIRPLDAYGAAEIADLAENLFDLAERLVERTEYLRSFAAHVSHELKSPLTAIKGAAELMHDDATMTEAERRHFLASIVAEADRLDALLARLRELARAELPTAGDPARLELAIPALRSRFPGLTLSTRGLDAVSTLPEEALVIVLGHLAANALAHGATRLDLSATVGDAVVLVVGDDGTGISPGNRERIFQPFFTTRREQGGTGMGLDIVRAMLRAHRGDIALVASERGAAFALTLPRQIS